MTEAPPVLQSSPTPNDIVIVIVTQEFDMTDVNIASLLEHGAILQSELTGNILATNNLINIPLVNSAILIQPNRIQILFQHSERPEFYKETYSRILLGLQKITNQIKASAIGINFGFIVLPPDGTSFYEWTKMHLASPLALETSDCDDARFGSYFSKNINSFRMKLDIKPVTMPIQETDGKESKKDIVRYGFNFHKNTVPSKNNIDSVINELENHTPFLAEAKRIVEAGAKRRENT